MLLLGVFWPLNNASIYCTLLSNHAYLSQEKSAADKAVFEELHSQMGMIYRFATVTNAEVLKETKYTSGSTVIVHKPVSIVLHNCVL